MNKKYREYLPSEMGTIKQTNWTWFLVDLGQDRPWYTNGHIAAAVSPVKEFPAEAPMGMIKGKINGTQYRWKSFVTTPFDGHVLAHYLTEIAPGILTPINKTERTGTPARDDYKPGVVTLCRAGLQEVAAEIAWRAARHYYSWIMGRFPGAKIHPCSTNSLILVFTVDDEPVAILQSLPTGADT